MSTTAELQDAIRTEKARHAVEMRELNEQHQSLCVEFDDQQQSFTELITRVTQLRVARGERLAAELEGRATTFTINTGSELVDGVLLQLQEGLSWASTSGKSIMTKLESAALSAVAPRKHDRPPTLSSDSKATRTTGLLFLTRCDDRGVRPWAQKHFKHCSACAARRAALPKWETQQYEEKLLGLAAAPNLHEIPGKATHTGTVRLLCEPPISKREGQATLEVVRATVVVQAATSAGAPLSNPSVTAQTLTEVVNRWVKKGLEVAKQEAKEAAWNQKEGGNLLLSGAVDMFLHSLLPTAAVRVASPPAKNAVKGATYLTFAVALATPLQISTLAPFVELLEKAEHRAYLIEKVVQPLAQRLGQLLGMSKEVLQYTAVAVNALSVLYDMVQKYNADVGAGTNEGSPRSATKSSQKGKPAEPDVVDQIYNICHALAVFNTTLSVQTAVPLVGEVHSVTEAKRGVVKVAEAFLQNLLAPSGWKPPGKDPYAADAVVKLERAPTLLLEIINRTFSSNKRLPASSRTSNLDFVVSPKSKISLGLKLFSELYVEVFRPYYPDCGTYISDENGKGGRPKAPPCAPVVDLPSDIVKANIAVHKEANELFAMLKKAEEEAAVETEIERVGEELADRIVGELSREELLMQMKKELDDVDVSLTDFSTMTADVMLPFGSTSFDMSRMDRSILYLRVEGEKGQ